MSQAGRLLLRSDLPVNGVKVFSATMFADREQLGDKVTQWLAASSHIKPCEIRVTQSSDSQYHCIALTVFYHEALAARRA